ncbi:MAG: hypothetical protein Q6K99_06835 [Thermostichales cyanobacterium BF4_bins_65]
MITTPVPLRQSFERFMLEVTEPLDPLLALKLTQLVLSLTDTAYAMGYSDGQALPRCAECPQVLQK